MSDWKALRTARFRYIARASGQEVLYDLSKEFGEYCDVAGEPAYAAALADLRHELLKRLLVRERPAPRTWTY